MQKKYSLPKRMLIAKGLGVIIGLFGFFMLPVIWDGADSMLRWGILLWYTTFGAIIGIFGLLTTHPCWKSISLPFWVRGTLIGAWMNFVLVFFAHAQMLDMLESVNIMGLTCPFWFVLEGAILGFIIDMLATKYGGEGKSLL